MKFVKIKFSDEEYEILKKYAKARRKYEVGKGFTISDTIQQVVSIGMDAIKETQILDNKGNLIEWKTIK